MGMNIFCALLVGLFFINTPVYAQHQPPSITDVMANLKSTLDLTQDQATAITPIIEKYSSQRQGVVKSMKPSEGKAILSRLQGLEAQEAKELGQILNQQQVSQWEKMMDQKDSVWAHPNNGAGK